MKTLRRWSALGLQLGLIVVSLGVVIGLQRPTLEQLKLTADQQNLDTLQRAVDEQVNQLAFFEQLPTFGFDNLMADWVFLQFLQYFGDTPARLQTSYALSPDFFDIILDRDPYFRDGYFFLSGTSSLYAGRPDRTIEIMNREIVHLTPFVPDRSYYVWRYKAIDEFLFLSDFEAAKNSLNQGADWAEAYANQQPQGDESAQKFVESSRQYVQAISDNPKSRNIRIAVLAMALNSAIDDYAQQLIIQQIEALGGTVTEDGQILLNELPN